MNHRELVDAAGGFITEPQKLISGGPMMGFAMVTLDAPVTKTSSSILAFQRMRQQKQKRLPASTADVVWKSVRAGLFLPDWQIFQSVTTKKDL